MSDFDYIQQARDSGEPVTSDVLWDSVLQRSVVYLAAPVKEGNRVVGLVQATIDLTDTNLEELVHALALGETGYAEIVDSNGIVLASTRGEHLFEKGSHSERFAALIREGGTVRGTCHDCHTSAQGVEIRKDVLA